ncbi:MAG: iron hydrogenase [Patescibacteria group bacterium]|nr:iron hydrogenase [Patescibacteria group bacterium]
MQGDMNNTKILTINREKIISLTQFAVLIGVATIAPFLGQQAITGPIVNATLFISTIFLGIRAGILISLLPSIIALSTGILPLALAPMIPFIMMGNIILVLSFDFLRGKNYWLRIFTASALKFIFLFSSSSILVNLITKTAIANRVAIIMSWPQFLTAIAGGIIAYLVSKKIKHAF